MKKNLCLIVFASMLAGCSMKPGFEIEGTASGNGLNGNYVYLYALGEKDAPPIDSALVENNQFAFAGSVDAPILCAICLAPGAVLPDEGPAGGGFPAFNPWLVLDNAQLTVTLGARSAVNGTPENDQLTAYMQLLDNLSANMSVDTEAEYEMARQQANALHKEYIMAHADNLSGAAVLVNNRYSLPEEDRRELLLSAGATFRSVAGINEMEQHLAVLAKVAVGLKFTDFDMADTLGVSHKLSEYAGKSKVVLIDFWASWCPPCRRDMPHLVELYGQYQAQGFQIVGISLDNSREAWTKGIGDLGITWPQLSDLQGWKNSAAALYGVNSIPHTVLIDGQGVIIAKGLRGQSLDEKLAEILK